MLVPVTFTHFLCDVLPRIARDSCIRAGEGIEDVVTADAAKRCLLQCMARGNLLLRVVHQVESSGDIVVITAYKTSKVAKYRP